MDNSSESYSNASLRVLIVTYTGGTGGVAVLIRNLVERFRWEPGIYLEVCFTQELGPIAEEIRAMGVKVHFLAMNGGLDLLKGWRLISLIRSNNFHVVDFHGIIPLVRVLIALSGVKGVIVDEHGAIQGDRMRGRSFHKYFHRVLDRWTSRYVVVCKPSADDLIKHHHVDPAKITLVYNGVQIDRFKRSGRNSMNLRSRLGISDMTPIVGTVRGLIPKMGLDHLVEAARVLSDSGINAAYILVGEGPLRAALEAMVEQYGLKNSFYFLGTRRDIPELLREFDVFVLPSVWEGLPIAAIEGLAAGVPVVAYDVGGNREVVVDKVTGILVPHRDPGLFAQAIARILGDPQFRKQLAKNASSYAEENFDIRTTARAFLTMYRSLALNQPMLSKVD